MFHVTLFAAALAVALPGEPAFGLRTTRAGHELTFANTTFHATRGLVQDLRQVDVPGSPAKVAVWNERGQDGTLRPFYAISSNGRTVAVVCETSYALALRRASFDPLVEAPDFSGSRLPPSGEVFFVQFVTQPLDGYRAALEAAGATLYNFVANHAYLVRMDAATAAHVAQLPFVRWVGPYHPEFRLDELILQGLASGALTEVRPYNVQVFEQGLVQKQSVAARIAALGGVVEGPTEGGNLMRAELTPAALIEVAAMDEVIWIDPWGAGEDDMNIARQIGGADYVFGAAGFDGTGVRGEVLDSGFSQFHPEFSHKPLIVHNASASGSHGASTSGEVFALGVNATARGMLPDAQGIISAYGSLGDRVVHSQQLLAAPYFAVFQTNSWGNPQTTQYTSISQEMDLIIFQTDLIITQSQSNTGNQSSRPQAWGKNMVSVGGIRHQNTLAKADDTWSSGASIGPAADGRIKPDLAHFYDNIFTTTSGTSYTSSFGGTSGATPIVAGHFGLFFEMWHNGIFGNPHPGATVFDNRPHSTTAKAFMVNTGSSYPFSGTGHDITRTHQGWGLPDVQRLYDRRDEFYFVNETDVVANLETATHCVHVTAAEPELRATLVYLDKEGTTSAAQHRINDLTLKVTSPGGTVYWGNNGLLAGNFSTAGGAPNTKDTVENVFVQNPQAGEWTIEVQASEVNVDTHVETPQVDADYALVVHPVEPSLTAFCTAKTGLSCGTPAIASAGWPSASATSGFTVSAGPALGGRAGFLLYNTSTVPGVPFAQTGTLCVNPSGIRRAGIVGSGGTPNQCDGSFAIDMNAFASGNHVPPGGFGVTTPAAFLSTPGTRVFTQIWGRDSPATGELLSDGLGYCVNP
jgi:hypothetical protein